MLHLLRQFTVLSVAVVLALGACSCRLSQVRVDASPEVLRAYARSGDLAAEVAKLSQPLIDSGTTPGLIVGVLTADGETHLFSFGLADKEQQLPMRSDYILPVGSLSKGYLAALTAIAVDKGELAWNDTLAQRLPGVPMSPAAGAITVEQLATHTSGLPRQPLDRITLTRFGYYLFTGESFYAHIDQSYIFAYLQDFTGAPPGPRYSNIGYALLSHILCQRSGMSLDALSQTRLLQPLGLTHTAYAAASLPPELQCVRGYAGDQPKFIRRGHPVPDWDFTEIMRGPAALHANAEDLLRFAAAHIRGPEDRLHQLLADNLRVRLPRAERAAAIAWIEDRIGDDTISYQLGFVAGYSSYLGLDRTHGTAVVVLQNSFNWTNTIGHSLLLRLAAAERLKQNTDHLQKGSSSP